MIVQLQEQMRSILYIACIDDLNILQSPETVQRQPKTQQLQFLMHEDDQQPDPNRNWLMEPRFRAAKWVGGSWQQAASLSDGQTSVNQRFGSLPWTSLLRFVWVMSFKRPGLIESWCYGKKYCIYYGAFQSMQESMARNHRTFYIQNVETGPKCSRKCLVSYFLYFQHYTYNTLPGFKCP